ncbi:MAG TPA: hypothetical protein VN086_02265 [Candidatus Paceibacterota bacterium]|nr:hypothetical protein [Candidatus Paceibacterota bacterium]
MTDGQVNRTFQSFIEGAADGFYGYFEPVRTIFRGLFLRHYRVRWIYDGGMTLLRGEETFTASHDREARRKAREIAGCDDFKLEMYRPITEKKHR